jgi:hypothetical protein
MPDVSGPTNAESGVDGVGGVAARLARPRLVAALAAGLSLGLPLALPGQARADDDACTDAGTAIVVDTGARILALCERGTATSTFPVAIGGGGVGKQREGDDRTPLGAYPLGAPRRSSAYGTFIPIGFPTAAQRARGVTGGAIGIHGPDRRLRRLGRLAVALGWTRGCVAVSSDDEMTAISRWVRRHRGAAGRRDPLSIQIR